MKKAPPIEVAHILIWYLELRRQTVRGFRFEPVQFSEVVAYQALFSIEMNDWEIGLIFDLDAIWQRVQPEPDKGANDNRRRR